jgi:hypothetical protein
MQKRKADNRNQALFRANGLSHLGVATLSRSRTNLEEASMNQALDLRLVRVVSVIVAVVITAALAAPLFETAARIVG